MRVEAECAGQADDCFDDVEGENPRRFGQLARTYPARQEAHSEAITGLDKLIIFW
jgi:hypothetical protein